MMDGIINQHQPRTSKKLNYDGSLIQAKGKIWRFSHRLKLHRIHTMNILYLNFIRFVISRICSTRVGEHWLRILNETWAVQAIMRLCCEEKCFMRLCENHSNYDTRGRRITLRWTDSGLDMIWMRKKERRKLHMSKFGGKVWNSIFLFQGLDGHK